MDQPYGRFAKALLEKQDYPNLLGPDGNPIAPYDVTAHTLPLLFNVQAIAVDSDFKFERSSDGPGFGRGCSCGGTPEMKTPRLYRSSMSNMDEGWSRWIFETSGCSVAGCNPPRTPIVNADIRNNNLQSVSSIVFPDQSANQILNGYAKGSMPDEYVGGVGKEGVENLKKFVENGGTLVFLERIVEFRDRAVRPAGQKYYARFAPKGVLHSRIDPTHRA